MSCSAHPGPPLKDRQGSQRLFFSEASGLSSEARPHLVSGQRDLTAGPVPCPLSGPASTAFSAPLLFISHQSHPFAFSLSLLFFLSFLCRTYSLTLILTPIKHDSRVEGLATSMPASSTPHAVCARQQQTHLVSPSFLHPPLGCPSVHPFTRLRHFSPLLQACRCS